jgi:hypothetical protein
LEWSADVRFGAHNGLKSDIAPYPKSAMNGRCLNCRTRAVADRHHREAGSTAFTCLAHLPEAPGADVRVVVPARRRYRARV